MEISSPSFQMTALSQMKRENHREESPFDEFPPFETLPTFGTLFSISPDFITQYIRRRKEIDLLQQISSVGNQLDVLIKQCVLQAQESEMLEESCQTLRNCPITTPFSPVIPILNQETLRQKEMEEQTNKIISTNIEQLNKLKESLTQYIEMNRDLAIELQSEGCEQLAQDKIKIANEEESLHQRLENFFKGNPYST